MTDPDVEAAIADAHRRGWGLVVASTVRVARDLDLAEQCVQEAYAAALTSWRAGIPRNPLAWLTTTARRRAIDAIRREQVFRSKLPLLVDDGTMEDEVTVDGHDGWARGTAADRTATEDTVPDERLRLIFLCCHPALPQDGQLALTLRLVCGVSTADIARAFLVSETTMAARITRAKRKIAVSRIPYRVPGPAELPDRLRAVLGVIHLLFTTGHAAPSGATLLRVDLVDEAIRLARTLRELMPDEREVWGLLALLLVTDARRSTRLDDQGRLLRLQEQDRSLWNRASIDEAHDLIVDSLRAGQRGRYLLQAAIASLYAEAPDYERTDWPQIVALYDELLRTWPSPVVALNRAVPLAMVEGPDAALREVAQLEDDDRLARYHYLPAIKADLLLRAGRPTEAAAEYRRALELTDNDAERAFVAAQLAELEADIGGD